MCFRRVIVESVTGEQKTLSQFMIKTFMSVYLNYVNWEKCSLSVL